MTFSLSMSWLKLPNWLHWDRKIVKIISYWNYSGDKAQPFYRQWFNFVRRSVSLTKKINTLSSRDWMFALSWLPAFDLTPLISVYLLKCLPRKQLKVWESNWKYGKRKEKYSVPSTSDSSSFSDEGSLHLNAPSCLTEWIPTSGFRPNARLSRTRMLIGGE